MFRSAYFAGYTPVRSVALSAVLHVAVIAALLTMPDLPGMNRRPRALPNPFASHEVLYYTRADLLPAISPVAREPAASEPSEPDTTTKPESAKTPERGSSPSVPVSPAYQPRQQIASQPAEPDNQRQTIVQPDAPRIRMEEDLELPNMIAWNSPAVPPPPAPEMPAPRVALTKLQFPVQPVKPEPVQVEKVEPEIPAPPQLRNIIAQVSALPLADMSMADVPSIPVPVALERRSEPEPEPETMAEVTPRSVPPAPVIRAASPSAGLPGLIAVNVAPPPPPDRIIVPPGNRSGEFAVAPDGKALEGGTTDRADGGGTAASGADLHIPGLSIESRTGHDSSTPLAGKAKLDNARASKFGQLLAMATRPRVDLGGLPASRPEEDEFFGPRRVYTVHLNMPNLSSESGSWVLRFAEMEEDAFSSAQKEDISKPAVLRKVDPKFDRTAIRDKIRGSVRLAAMLLRDGSVANIRVVESLDVRLDASAAAALTQWRFRPATKNGSPIPLEMLVEIPFIAALF